ncbi:MAG: amidase family protein [Acetobacteraceae bacterium]|jgi:amidase|nr:amidase family protein [Acetobacteraceae bacterium]
MSNDLTALTATEAVTLLKKGDISPLEMVDAAVKRIEIVDPVINALPIRFFDDARRAAETYQKLRKRGEVYEGPGALYGLPIAVKDFNDVAGQRTTSGSPIFEGKVAARSDTTVERLQERGAIPIAKSNVPEFAGAHTFNTLFGVTRNPWNTGRSAGGSSGGSAAALASGMVWLATGNDLGGSLRIPASFCGVAALRPSVGRVARPQFMPAFDSLGSEGPMGRTIDDVALMLDAEAGPSRDDPLAYPAPVQAFARTTRKAPPNGLKIAYTPNLGLLKIDDEVDTICSSSMLRLGANGFHVENDTPDFTGAIECFGVLRAQLFATIYGDLVEEHGNKLPVWVRDNFQKGLDLKVSDIMAADRHRVELYRRLATFLARYDLLAFPAVALPPFDANEKFPTVLAGQKLKSYIDWMFLTFVTTLTSCPIIAVPCGLTADGLPVSIQILGRPHSDGLLLQVGRVVERMSGIAKRLPLQPGSASAVTSGK